MWRRRRGETEEKGLLSLPLKLGGVRLIRIKKIPQDRKGKEKELMFGIGGLVQRKRTKIPYTSGGL